MNPEFQVHVWAKITFFVWSHGNQRWKWRIPWSKQGLHPRKCCWHPCPPSWCGRGWGCIFPKLLEQCWGLALGLLCSDGTKLLFWSPELQEGLFSSQWLSHFWGLKHPSNISATHHNLIRKQVLIKGTGNYPERVPGYNGNGCHKNVMLDTSTR